MSDLKPLSKDSIPNAIKRAQHYRLLNEPWQAESICRDILRVDPDHQLATLTLILAITDQFAFNKFPSDKEAKDLCNQLTNEYEQHYYRGIIAERQGKSALRRKTPRASYIAYDFYRQAMELYEKAEVKSPEDNEDSVLRWNACVRAIREHNLKAAPKEDRMQPFLDV